MCDTKKCKSCKLNKEISQFKPIGKPKKNGERGINCYCVSCVKIKNAEYTAIRNAKLERVCSKCNLLKNKEDFLKGRTECKECGKKDAIKNKDSRKISRKKYYENNKEKYSEYQKQHRKELNDYRKEWGEKNPDKVKSYYLKQQSDPIKRAKKNQKTLEKYHENLEESRQKNKEKARRLRKQDPQAERRRTDKWKKNNREQFLKAQRKNNNYRYYNDEVYRIKKSLRSAIRRAGRGVKVKGDTLILLGCSVDEFIQYLKKTLPENATWENYMNGDLHIDHIIPLSYYDLTILEQRKIAFKFDNHQLLWGSDNLEKSDIMPDGVTRGRDVKKEKEKK